MAKSAIKASGQALRNCSPGGLAFLIPAGTNRKGGKNTIVYTPLKWYKAKRNPRAFAWSGRSQKLQLC